MSTSAGLRTPRVAAPPIPALRTLVVLTADGVRRRGRTIAAWGLALGAMSALMLAIWPFVDGQIDDALASYPEALKEAFGLSGMTTAEQYVDAEMLSLVVPFAVALLAVRCVATATVGAEDRGELDVLLTLPVPRFAVATSAVLAAALVALATLVIGWTLACLGSLLAGAGADPLVLARGYLNVWPLAVLAGALALLVGGRLRGSGPVTGVAAGSLVAMYLLDLVGRLSGALEPLRTFSAFAYYGSAIRDGVQVGHVAALLVAATGACAVGAALWQHRDVG